MHWYEIPAGTAGRLIINHRDRNVEVKEWVTRKELMFTETVHDPIREANGNQDYPHDCLLRRLVRDGNYAIFGGEFGGDSSALYMLAVPYYITQRWQEGRDY